MEDLLIISSILLWILMLLNILITIGLARRINRQMPKIETLNVGDRAPDFEATQYGGKMFTTSNFNNEPIALIFLSPGCAPCEQEKVHVRKVLTAAKKQGVALAVVSDKTEEDSAAFFDGLGTEIPILIAPRTQSSFLDDYKVQIWPLYYLIGHNRKILTTGSSLETLELDIQTVFSEGSVNLDQ